MSGHTTIVNDKLKLTAVNVTSHHRHRRQTFSGNITIINNKLKGIAINVRLYRRIDDKLKNMTVNVKSITIIDDKLKRIRFVRLCHHRKRQTQTYGGSCHVILPSSTSNSKIWWLISGHITIIKNKTKGMTVNATSYHHYQRQTQRYDG